MSLSVFERAEDIVKFKHELFIFWIIFYYVLSKVGFHETHRQGIGENADIFLKSFRIEVKNFLVFVRNKVHQVIKPENLKRFKVPIFSEFFCHFNDIFS